MSDNESENVTGLVYLHQLLIYLYNLELLTKNDIRKTYLK